MWSVVKLWGSYYLVGQPSKNSTGVMKYDNAGYVRVYSGCSLSRICNYNEKRVSNCVWAC